MSRTPAPAFEIIDRNQIIDQAGLIVTYCQDCACPMPPMHLPDTSSQSTYLAHQNAHYCTPELRVESLIDGYQSVFNPTGEVGVVVLNPVAYDLLRRFDKPTPLTTVMDAYEGIQEETGRTLVRLIALGLLQRPYEAQRPLTTQEKLLTAWMHVTNQCNLRCTYCYLNKTNEYMSQVTGRAAVDAVIRSALAEAYSAIKFKYAGGEAFLNINRIFDIHDYAVTQCQQNDITLQAVILTNGTILIKTGIEGLKIRKIKVMVSLDGLGYSHDVQRPFRGGQNSAQQVLAGIKRLIDQGLPPHLSITISDRNCEQIDEVVRFALERNLTFSLNFYRENDCSASFTDLQYCETRMIAGMRAAFHAIEENLPAWSVVGAILDRGQLLSPHEHACGVTRDYLVIDHYGRISKCQMEIDKAVTDIHHPNPLEMIRFSPIGVQNPSVLEKEGCRDCTWRYWCTGGCPVATYRAMGRYDVKSPNCNIYKAIYPEAIRLEGLRLLKYANRPGKP